MDEFLFAVQVKQCKNPCKTQMFCLCIDYRRQLSPGGHEVNQSQWLLAKRESRLEARNQISGARLVVQINRSMHLIGILIRTLDNHHPRRMFKWNSHTISCCSPWVMLVVVNLAMWPVSCISRSVQSTLDFAPAIQQQNQNTAGSLRRSTCRPPMMTTANRTAR